ncbi:ArdC family protein [Kribbella ginsengisoli]|uniref:N-terminal domain-containing protein n=1 Tax=Kribbella ginsengisoli TaxID=363865 RepID=A0ABP6Z5G1_9ACTN
MSRAKLKTEDLLARIEAEVRRLRSGDDWKRWLKAAAQFHQYSFGNVLLIQLQRPDATRVAGYGDWQKLGRQVIRGETGIKILAPVWSRKTDTVAHAEQDQPQDREAKPAKVRSGRRLIGFRTTVVFDISQTTGEPLPAGPTPQPVVGQVPPGLWEALAAEVSNAGFTLAREKASDLTVDGYTDHDEKKVVVATHLDDVSAVACLAHEIAHMRMHSIQEVVAAGTIMCRGTREVEAESVAYVLLSHHGLETDQSSFGYIAGWAATVDKGTPEKVLQATGRRVTAMAKQLINSTDRFRGEISPVPVRPEISRSFAYELPGVELDFVGPIL